MEYARALENSFQGRQNEACEGMGGLLCVRVGGRRGRPPGTGPVGGRRFLWRGTPPWLLLSAPDKASDGHLNKCPEVSMEPRVRVRVGD